MPEAAGEGRSGQVFRTWKRIRFSQCDPAGIVFYPRYAELCNEVVEDWFRDGLGVDFHELHEIHRLGVPAVRFEAEYHTASRYNDLLEFSLRVREIGNTSMGLHVEGMAEGRVRVGMTLKVVFTSMDDFRPVRIEGEWRRKFSDFLCPKP